MNYREQIRKAIDCPQFGGSYGEWGALRFEQRAKIKRLIDELDSADNYILVLQQRIDKAIEYIENPRHEMSVLTYQNLLTILRGEDNE